MLGAGRGISLKTDIPTEGKHLIQLFHVGAIQLAAHLIY